MYVHAEHTVEVLYRAHYEKLCAFARSYVGCPDTAEDIVQDVFVQLWRLRECGDTFASPKTYLYSAVRNRALKHVKHERFVCRSHAMMQWAGRSAGMSQAPASADEQVEAEELEAAYDDAVDHLPRRCREAYLYWRVGKTPAEVAAAMGTSVRTAETHAARARRRLRRELVFWL